MKKPNKAHTATVNRIARRYNLKFNEGDGVDFQTDEIAIDVETTATLDDGLERLLQISGPAYLAVTNMEAVQEAIRQTQDTPIGVMDPKGNIIKEAEAD